MLLGMIVISQMSHHESDHPQHLKMALQSCSEVSNIHLAPLLLDLHHQVWPTSDVLPQSSYTLHSSASGLSSQYLSRGSEACTARRVSH